MGIGVQKQGIGHGVSEAESGASQEWKTLRELRRAPDQLANMRSGINDDDETNLPFRSLLLHEVAPGVMADLTQGIGARQNCGPLGCKPCL